MLLYLQHIEATYCNMNHTTDKWFFGRINGRIRFTTNQRNI